MARAVLTDAQWRLMEPHCLDKPGGPGRGGIDNRRFLEAVLWKARTNSPWRDLPGSWANGTRCFSVLTTGRRRVIYPLEFCH